MSVNILFGFDSERPYGPHGQGEKGLADRKKNFDIIRRINTLLDQHKAGRTFFILGVYLDQSVDQLGREEVRETFQPENDLVEIGQHTYSHPVIARIPTRPDKTPVSPENLRFELKQAEDYILEYLGVKPRGLRTPLGYARGLRDAPEAVIVIGESGISYVSSDLRDKNSGLNAPLIEDGQVRQPFRYANKLIEIPSHGFQDTSFTGTSRTQSTERYPQTVDEIFDHYLEILNQADGLDIHEQKRLVPNDIHIGLCMHPWAIAKYDPDLEVLTKILETADDRGFNKRSYNTVLENFR